MVSLLDPTPDLAQRGQALLFAVLQRIRADHPAHVAVNHKVQSLTPLGLGLDPFGLGAGLGTPGPLLGAVRISDAAFGKVDAPERRLELFTQGSCLDA
jgi:hypothetical protein